MKTRVTLEMFKKFILASLQTEFADKLGELQKHVDENFDVYEVDAGGKEQPVKLDLNIKSAPKTQTIDIDDKIKSVVSDAIKSDPKPHPTNAVEFKTMDWMGAGLKLCKPIKSFTGTNEEKRKAAYLWGAFFLGGVVGQQKWAGKFAELTGEPIRKAQSEGVNTAGGVLVPEVLDASIIDLREQYGVFRRNARRVMMSRDVQAFPRRVSGLTAYFAGEAAALTESSKAWDSVSLTAKKLTALAKISSELNEDAIINIGDDIASEIVYAFSYTEDLCGFLGTGAGATYGGIVGANVAIKSAAGTPTTTSAGGVVIAAGNTIAEVTLANFNTVVGTLPQYADTPNAKWYCSRFFWANSMERLARAAGGTTSMEIAGASHRTFLGYPVEISQVFPSTDTNSQILCLFGDLSLAATFGDRRETTISVSDQVYWANDQIGIKGTQRFDINVHDVGTTSAAGPIVALQALNS